MKISTKKHNLVAFIEFAVIAATFAVAGCTSFGESTYSKVNASTTTPFIPLTHDDGGYPLTSSGELAIDP